MMKTKCEKIVSGPAVGHMTAKDTSVFAWAYGMLGLRPSRVIRCLTREGLSTIQDATAHDLSNLAWGLARAGVGGENAEAEGEEEERAEAEGGREEPVYQALLRLGVLYGVMVRFLFLGIWNESICFLRCVCVFVDGRLRQERRPRYRR